MAAVWDQDTNEAYILLDGQKVGTQAQASGSHLRDNSHTVYDIGLKRDGSRTLRGYLRDLMIIGKALNEEELANITSILKLLSCITITLSTTPLNCRARGGGGGGGGVGGWGVWGAGPPTFWEKNNNNGFRYF